MIPSKVRHVVIHLKYRIAWNRQENITCKWIFAFLKIEMLKKYLSAVKRIGKRFVIKGILNRKIGSSGRPSGFTIKDYHRLKMTFLKFIRKLKKSRSVKEMGSLSKICGKNIFCDQQKFTFKTVILNLWSSFIVEPMWWPEPTFLINASLITNVCPILFTAERNAFNFFYFKISKFHL